MRELDDSLRAVEAILFAAEEPLGTAEIALHAGAGADVPALLAELQSHYAGRGVELVERGGRWHFQTAADLAFMQFKGGTWEGHMVMFARSGYTGEDGYEILVPPAGADAFVTPSCTVD